MADSRARPVPKPRTRQKSLPAALTELVIPSPHNAITPPGKKPPLKPKPTGYKTLDFNNTGLVSVTKDIIIDDSAPVKNEKNNNIIDIPSNTETYNKPLPPLPDNKLPISDDRAEQKILKKQPRVGGCESDTPVSPSGPNKPPRMVSPDHESPPELWADLGSNGELSKNVGDIKKRITPPLPRKPNFLKKDINTAIPFENHKTHLRPHSNPGGQSPDCVVNLRDRPLSVPTFLPTGNELNDIRNVKSQEELSETTTGGLQRTAKRRAARRQSSSDNEHGELDGKINRRKPPVIPTKNIVTPPKHSPPPPPISSPPKSTPVSSSRRLPPNRPKQPSFEKKTNAPPLPKAPRPASIKKPALVMKKSFSAGDMHDTKEDDTYWEAYQHLKESSKIDENVNKDTNSDYVSPDQNSVTEFMSSVSDKLKNKETVSDEKLQIKRKRFDRKTTYSSSSEDSSGYVDVDAEIIRKETKRGQPMFDNDNAGYVEAIHRNSSEIEDDLAAEITKKTYEFRPFSDMGDEEWTKPSVINWEYSGESESSDDTLDNISDDEYVFDEENEELEDEPLYQVYQANVFEKERTLSLKRFKKTSVPELATTPAEKASFRRETLRGGRTLWAQLPEVRNSCILDTLSSDDRKLQEAIYEVISSETSYLKSLNLLVEHFMTPKMMGTILNKTQTSELFSNVKEIITISEKLIEDLKTRQRQSVVVKSISDIIDDHATNNFDAYVTYCSHQYKQDRMLTDLRHFHLKFAEELEKLESDKRVFGLSLQSFLVLPMQRVTRYPLLVDAIVRRCEPGSDEYYQTDNALQAVNKVVYKCNEGARKEERHEEMLLLKENITFPKIKPIELATKDRWLVRQGAVQLLEFDMKSTLTNTLQRKFRKYRVKNIYLFLFHDLLLVTKKKSETMFSVIDYANRNMVKVQEAKSGTKNAFVLVLLENHEKKTKELTVRFDNETDLTRWTEAFVSSESEEGDEKIYAAWDCPQVHALHNYQAKQSDELSLVPGDVVNVSRKLADGWYEGERIRDGMCGWFPANHTEEIRSEHVRARNLHQRYRLLAASTAFLDKRKR